MKKKIAGFIILICLFMAVPMSISVQARELTQGEIEGAISWATSKLGQQNYNYYCLAFVSDAWRSQGIGNRGYEYATLAGNAMITNTDKNPPRGAVVFWDWSGTVEGQYKNWGHVGISLGDGRVVHADYNGVKITNIDIDSSRRYRGWGGWDGNTIPNYNDSGSKWRVTAQEGVNIREHAGTGYNRVGALAYNAIFYITERKKADGYIWGKTNNGWVVLDYATHVSGPIPDLKTDDVAPVHKDNNYHVRNGFFTLKNASSGKYLNLYGGGDYNGNKITMWSYDDSTDEQFYISQKGNGKYKLHPYGSNRGNGRVVDVRRGESAPQEGHLIELWDNNDDEAQLVYLWPVGNNEYVIELASKDGYVFTPSSASAANQDGAQLILQRYNGSAYQKWKLCNNNGKETTANVAYGTGSYKIDTNGVPIIMRNGAGTNATQVGMIADGAVFRVTKVSDNWGYTNYNGTNGWVCLDYSVYTVTLDSITVTNMPDKTSYYTGEQFDLLGMRITANYSNGQKEELTTGFTANADFSTAGEKTVTVAYKGVSTSFKVNVEDIEVTDVAMEETVIKKTYNVGDKIDTTGISLIVTYSNGNTALIDSGFETKYDFSAPGNKTVTVKYGGKSTSYEVMVTGNNAGNTALLQVEKIDTSTSKAEVPVTLTAKGVYDGNITIQYDNSKLSISDVVLGGVLSSRKAYVNKDYAQNQIRVTFSGTEAINTSDVALTLKFNVLSVNKDTSDIVIQGARLYDINGDAIECQTINGSVNYTPTVNSVTVTNVNTTVANGIKTVTATVSDDNVRCYLVKYDNGKLVSCDAAEPKNGTVTLSVPDGNAKLLVWNYKMKPLTEAKDV